MTRLNSWQAETIYRTETSIAYGAGQFAKLQDVAETFPYWQYLTAGDERVRDYHDKLNKKVFRVDDPEFYPPIGFNCRCTARPLTKKRAESIGIKKPDIVTPEMRGNLQNYEFVGDKVLNFKKWAEKKMESISADAVLLILELLATIENQLEQGQKK